MVLRRRIQGRPRVCILSESAADKPIPLRRRFLKVPRRVESSPPAFRLSRFLRDLRQRSVPADRVHDGLAAALRIFARFGCLSPVEPRRAEPLPRLPEDDAA